VIRALTDSSRTLEYDPCTSCVSYIFELFLGRCHQSRSYGQLRQSINDL